MYILIYIYIYIYIYKTYKIVYVYYNSNFVGQQFPLFSFFLCIIFFINIGFAEEKC